MKVEPKSDTSLRIVRRYAAAPSKVFEAWTRPEVMHRWLAPVAEMSTDAVVDLRVGGRYRISMTAPDGTRNVAVGGYELIEPGKKLVFTWSWEGNPAQAEDTLVTVEFAAAGTGTEMTLTHERFTGAEQRDKHTQGWSGCASRLEEVLAT